MPAERVAGILLAAGASSRFGADKLAVAWGGRTMLHRATTAMIDAGLDPVLVVVQPGVSAPFTGVSRSVPNPRWCEGLSTSVQTGLAALADDATVGAAVVAPADQPWCGAEVYRRLLDAFRSSGAGLLAASFDGAVRNPVLLERSRWHLADRIEGDIGLSAVVRGLDPMTVECADIGSVSDIDTASDLERARLSGAGFAQRCQEFQHGRVERRR